MRIPTMTKLIAALLLASAPIAFAPTAKADVCLNDDICAAPDVGVVGCNSVTRSYTGSWYYAAAGLPLARDPPLVGVYYVATWTYTYVYSGSGCTTVAAYSCDATV